MFFHKVLLLLLTTQSPDSTRREAVRLSRRTPVRTDKIRRNSPDSI
jgi:hypothetical protein